MKIFTTVFALLCFISSDAQKSWFFGPGLTYTIPGKQVRNVYTSIGESAVPDTLTNLRFEPWGRFGLYAEAGREWIWNNDKRVNGMDAGIHFKTLIARETIKGTLTDYSTDTITTSSFFSEQKFSGMYPGAFVNFFNHYQLNSKVWLRNNIGLNVDYGFSSGDGVTGIVGQVHYRFGAAFKVSERLRIMPSIETPILDVYTWQDFRSTLQFVDFKYRPIIFCVRFMLEDKAENKMDKGCLEIPDNRERPELWEPGMRKFRKGKG